MAVRRLGAHYVLTPQGFLRWGIVTLDESGKILDVCSSESPDSQHGIEFYSGIIVPGLVNAHCHLELSHLKGHIPEGCGFTGFARAMGSAPRDVTPEEREQSASFQDARMWAEGVSAVADISNTGVTLPVKMRSNILYHTYAEVYGLRTVSARPQKELVAGARQGGLGASLTPHSMYSLREGLMRETLGVSDAGLSIHFMESRDEIEFFNGRGPMYDWDRETGLEEDFTALYSSPRDRFMSHIPTGKEILLVHNTFVTEEDVDIMNRFYGDRLTWVVCPRSNAFITGDAPPLDMMIRKGCRIAVGTDSLASNHSLSVIEELKAIQGVPLVQKLRWATANGAAALGMDAQLGTIETGKKPGIVLLEKVDMDNMRLSPQSASRRLV